jgi:hypothetical protein
MMSPEQRQDILTKQEKEIEGFIPLTKSFCGNMLKNFNEFADQAELVFFFFFYNRM